MQDYAEMYVVSRFTAFTIGHTVSVYLGMYAYQYLFVLVHTKSRGNESSFDLPPSYLYLACLNYLTFYFFVILLKLLLKLHSTSLPPLLYTSVFCTYFWLVCIFRLLRTLSFCTCPQFEKAICIHLILFPLLCT